MRVKQITSADVQLGSPADGIFMRQVYNVWTTSMAIPNAHQSSDSAARRAGHFLAVSVPPVFISLLTPWVWLGWSITEYLGAGSSMVAGAGLVTFATNRYMERRRRNLLIEQRYSDLTPVQQDAAAAIDQSLESLVSRSNGYQDAEVEALIKHIVQAIRKILPMLVSESAGDPEYFYTVRQTALDYLPATLDAYQRIPSTDGAPAEGADPHSPRNMLLEQLRLIDANIQQMVSQMAIQSRQAMKANGRFLEERFSGNRLSGLTTPANGEQPPVNDS